MDTFSSTLLDYFFHLNHVGVLESGENHYSIIEGEQTQGDVIKLCLQCCGDTLSLVRFQCYGGPPLMAACEYVCRWLEGKTLEEALSLTSEHILKALQLSRLHIHVAVRLVDLVKKIIGEIQ